MPNSRLPVPYKNCSMVLEFSGLSPTGYYVSEEMMTSATLIEESGYVVTGDHTGALRLFLPRNKHKGLSDVLKKNVYKATHVSEISSQKRHQSEVVYIKSAKNGTDVYSADKSGRILSWQVLARKGAHELVPVNYIDLDGEISFMSLEDGSAQLFAGCHGDLCQMSSSITPSTPVTSRSVLNSTVNITALFCTSLDIIMTGFSNGDIRLFIDIHKDAVLKLVPATDCPIVLIFPGNYSRMDKVSRKITVMECLASIHVVDSRGRLFIYDIEDKIDKPDQTLELVTEDQPFSILDCQ
jgi:hypothetical protein